ncbi:MAG: hypothetical protein BWX47_02076 [candidate division Hyd24-12 bacterium ADurb.Bin004]|nr:MAG: hypothetical protein BWX47_02076 [candidate division Hyd24-12 bacterium ADurb.Bin004]
MTSASSLTFRSLLGGIERYSGSDAPASMKAERSFIVTMMRLIGLGGFPFAGETAASIPNAPSSRMTGISQEAMSNE